MIVMLVKLQVEHKGRLRVCQWEIEIAGGAVHVAGRRAQQRCRHAMCLPSRASMLPGPIAGRLASTSSLT
jgi:hypothetical protein